MKVLFLASGPIEFASARLRCYWPAKYMDADVAEIERTVSIPVTYDVYVMQKHALKPDVAREILAAGKQLWWDHCDPMWWFSPDIVRPTLDNVTGVICSTHALANDLEQWGNARAYIIPDRFEMSHFHRQKEHRETDMVRFIWYGLGPNRISLASVWANLHRLAINGYLVSLTLMDDNFNIPLGFGNEIPMTYIEWRLKDEVDMIASHDIALLPPYPGPWGGLKSPNKAQTANLCGLPVTTGLSYYELVRLVGSAKERERIWRLQSKEKDSWDVQHTARELESLFNAHV